MTPTLELTQEQVSKLRSLHFWNRNLIVAKRDEDQHEIEKSRKAIQMIFEDCDRLEIPYSKQNRVLQGARDNVSFCDIPLTNCNVSLKNESKAFSMEDFDIMIDRIYNNGYWLFNKALSKGVSTN